MSDAPVGLALVVGLGNPGDRYQKTRHNVGYWYVEHLARRFDQVFCEQAKFHGQCCAVRCNGRDVRLLKPSTFMNHSGQAVSSITKYLKLLPEHILVAHDDIDLPCGTVRLKREGGHGGHNGLRDIIQALGSKQFWRLRFGVGHPGHRDQVVDYVLRAPSRAECDAIDMSIDMASQETEALFAGQFEAVMRQLHRQV